MLSTAEGGGCWAQETDRQGEGPLYSTLEKSTFLTLHFYVEETSLLNICCHGIVSVKIVKYPRREGKIIFWATPSP
jgi:hypothetical protein